MDEAAAHGTAMSIRRLITNGVAIDAIDRHNQTPLMYAAESGNRATMMFLLNANASVLKQDDRGRTAERIAAEHGHSSLVQLLKDYTIRAMDEAAAHGSASSIREFIARGLPVDVTDKSNMTPLMHAVESDNKDAMDVLLKVHANVLRHDSRGRTAKRIAVEQKHLDLVPLLEINGAWDYAGDTLPHSSYDVFLLGKVQEDATADFYMALPFLNPGLRFFRTYSPAPRRIGPPPPPPPNPGAEPAATHRDPAYFAVARGDRVIRLMSPKDIAALDISIRNPENALLLLRLSPDYLEAKSDGLTGVELPGFDSPGNCYHMNTAALKRAGIDGASVRKQETKGGTVYLVTRYFVTNLPQAGHGEYFPTVRRVRQRVDEHGHITLVGTEDISAPGFSIAACRLP